MKSRNPQDEGAKLSFDVAGCSSSVERSVRDREAEGPIPFTPTKFYLTNRPKSFSINLWKYLT